MLNYTVDPALLTPFVPQGTELDYYKGETFVSVVGFMFLNTRVIGVAVPLHQDFEEVNLRFYVKRRAIDGWRRGVVFVRELVPRMAIATVARLFYGEPYTALPMRHSIRQDDNGLTISYEWRRNQKWESLNVRAKLGEPVLPEPDSHEKFIAEHYWGFSRGRRTSAYRVEHPPWRIWNAVEASLTADIASLYGEKFVPALTSPAASQFIAEGSRVQVFRKENDPVLQSEMRIPSS